ncbi:MAG: 2Fe-2S iron-sulfur cluster-binding protein [Alphaproteobacteria bacterium]
MSLKVTFIMRDGSQRLLEAQVGQSLLDVSRQHNIDDVEGACGGAMACSTCHMIIDPKWFGKLPGASDDEIDMLDLAPGITKTSRLGCQIRLTEAMDGLIIKLPQTTFSLLG